jgi:hypothetical protein
MFSLELKAHVGSILPHILCDFPVHFSTRDFPVHFSIKAAVTVFNAVQSTWVAVSETLLG